MPSIVVMGVAGSGKSTLGAALAQALHLPMIEGDDFHPEANRDKMRRGLPLTDADRAGWLARLADALRAHRQGAVLTCSALKAAYRDGLRAAVPGLRFVFLRIERDEALRRVAARQATHYFPPEGVDNQFATLEAPQGEPDVLVLDATAPPAELCRQAVTGLQQLRS